VYDGKIVNPGVYAYQIDITYLDTKKQVKSGNVTVVR
jgi:hypothetical protein